jgi:MFS family permease
MQSAWAVGYGAAALVVAVVMPVWGWRAVFFAGVLPALLTIWVQKHVTEPALWRERQALPAATRGSLADVFRGDLLRLTVAVSLMNACTMFAWWGFNQWIPAYLSLAPADGGLGLSTQTMSGFIIAMQVGMWFGYVTFGFISDAIGRKRAYVMYLLTAAVLMLGYRATQNPTLLLLLGPVVAFFATGYFTGFGAVTAEIYPTQIRATAQGFTYNIGRIGSAIAPWAVGRLADSNGFGAAFSLAAVAFVLAAVMWIWIPETKGRALG